MTVRSQCLYIFTAKGTADMFPIAVLFPIFTAAILDFFYPLLYPKKLFLFPK
ncbi:hypothetical protein HMPREF1548_06714 [Clostridium sp. KLE 1755]|nr:hypothetical protein HMPREF1548_06714 [Clostridium sp. KLE 1755]